MHICSCICDTIDFTHRAKSTYMHRKSAEAFIQIRIGNVCTSLRDTCMPAFVRMCLPQH